MKQRDNIKIFSEYKVPKAVFTLALPTMVGMLITVFYNLADTFFVGQTGDTNQVAAVSVTMPLFFIFLAIGNLFGVGGCAYISRSIGEGKMEKIKSISSFSIFSALGVGMVIALCFIAFRRPILYLIGASNNTIEHANNYLFFLSLGVPFTVFTLTVSNLIRGEGAAKKSMIGSVMGQVVNIVLDPIFILHTGDRLFGFDMPFGLGLGVTGAAVATVIGNLVSFIYFLIYFTKGNSLLSISPKRYSVKDGIAKGVISVGFAASVTSFLMSISNIFVNMLLVKYGDDAVAAMGIAIKANSFVILLQIGMAQGVQPLVGYCYGAKRIERLKSTIKFGVMCNVIIGATITVIYMIFKRQILGLFIDDSSVIEHGVKMLSALMSPGAVIGIMFILNFSLQGMGKGVQSLILAVARQGLIFLPLVIIMDKAIGINGVIWAQPIADFACVLLAVALFVPVVIKENKLLNKNRLDGTNNEN